MEPIRDMRLLPWSGPEGKPCYVAAGGDGHVSRLADEMEAVQLAMGAELLTYARLMIADPTVTVEELRYLAARQCESLRDALRVAESRGARTGRPGPGDGEERGG